MNAGQKSENRELSYRHFEKKSLGQNWFYCVSDLKNSTIYPRPRVYFYEAKEICEKEHSSLITSLEPNFDFQRKIFLDFNTHISNETTSDSEN